MAEPKSKKVGNRKPKSLAYAFRILAGLIGKVDPLTGIYHSPVRSLTIAAADISPEIQKRFKEAGIVIVEPISNAIGAVPTQLSLRLPKPSDARQFELPLEKSPYPPNLAVYGTKSEPPSMPGPIGGTCCTPSVFPGETREWGPQTERSPSTCAEFQAKNPSAPSIEEPKAPSPEPVSSPTEVPTGGG